MTTVTTISIKRGALYLGRDVYERYFSGLEGVILLRQEHDLCILPVRHMAAGGYLLKLRNHAGDRVVNAPDFFREHGVSDGLEIVLPVSWSSERAALIAFGAFHL